MAFTPPSFTVDPKSVTLSEPRQETPTSVEVWKASAGLPDNVKCSPDTVRRLEEAIRAGLTEKQACLSAGVAYETYKGWKKKHIESDFTSPYGAIIRPCLEARLEKFKTVLGRLLEHGMENGKNWTALAWWLERTNPEEFARPELLMKQPDNVPKIVVQVGGNIENLNLQAILDAGTDKASIDAEVLPQPSEPLASSPSSLPAVDQSDPSAPLASAPSSPPGPTTPRQS